MSLTWKKRTALFQFYSEENEDIREKVVSNVPTTEEDYDNVNYIETFGAFQVMEIRSTVSHETF